MGWREGERGRRIGVKWGTCKGLFWGVLIYRGEYEWPGCGTVTSMTAQILS